MTRDMAKEILREAEIDEKARGETLSPERLAILTRVIVKKL
jgi:ribosomal protein S13